MAAPSQGLPHMHAAGWRVRRTFQGLCAALALGLCIFAPGIAAGATDTQRGELRVGPVADRNGTILMSWQGPIMAPMANQIKEAFQARKRLGTRVQLRISSYGGSVSEGERVIEVLSEIKATHEVETSVTQGDVCASMCVFIYVQGQKRFGALTSSWLFHEVSHMDPLTKQTTKLDRAAWERLVDKYFRPAGVSEAWIEDLKPRTVGSDYWQTGADLIRANSGIIHEPLANQTARLIVAAPPPKETAAAQPAPRRAAAGECRKYFPSIGAVVPVPCT